MPAAGAPPDDLALLTAEQVCDLLQMKKSWLYDAVERGEFPVIRLGRQLRFRRSAVSLFLDAMSDDGGHEHDSDRC